MSTALESLSSFSSLPSKFRALSKQRKKDIYLAIIATLCLIFVIASQLLTSFSLLATIIIDPSQSGISTKLFDYNLWEGVKQLWLHDAYALAILITIFSGVLPYFKLLLVIASAFTLPLSLQKQNRLAKWMFIIGKTSLFDVWFVGAAVTVIYFSVLTPNFRMKVTGIGELGVYLFFVSTFLAQVISYIHWNFTHKQYSIDKNIQNRYFISHKNPTPSQQQQQQQLQLYGTDTPPIQNPFSQHHSTTDANHLNDQDASQNSYGNPGNIRNSMTSHPNDLLVEIHTPNHKQYQGNSGRNVQGLPSTSGHPSHHRNGLGSTGNPLESPDVYGQRSGSNGYTQSDNTTQNHQNNAQNLSHQGDRNKVLGVDSRYYNSELDIHQIIPELEEAFAERSELTRFGSIFKNQKLWTVISALTLLVLSALIITFSFFQLFTLQAVIMDTPTEEFKYTFYNLLFNSINQADQNIPLGIILCLFTGLLSGVFYLTIFLFSFIVLCSEVRSKLPSYFPNSSPSNLPYAVSSPSKTSSNTSPNTSSTSTPIVPRGVGLAGSDIIGATITSNAFHTSNRSDVGNSATESNRANSTSTNRDRSNTNTITSHISDDTATSRQYPDDSSYENRHISNSVPYNPSLSLSSNGSIEGSKSLQDFTDSTSKLAYFLLRLKRAVFLLSYLNCLEIFIIALGIIMLELPAIMKKAGEDIVSVRVAPTPYSFVFGISILAHMVLVWPCLALINPLSTAPRQSSSFDIPARLSNPASTSATFGTGSIDQRGSITSSDGYSVRDSIDTADSIQHQVDGYLDSGISKKKQKKDKRRGESVEPTQDMRDIRETRENRENRNGYQNARKHSSDHQLIGNGRGNNFTSSSYLTPTSSTVTSKKDKGIRGTEEKYLDDSVDHYDRRNNRNKSLPSPRNGDGDLDVDEKGSENERGITPSPAPQSPKAHRKKNKSRR